MFTPVCTQSSHNIKTTDWWHEPHASPQDTAKFCCVKLDHGIHVDATDTNHLPQTPLKTSYARTHPDSARCNTHKKNKPKKVLRNCWRNTTNTPNPTPPCPQLTLTVRAHTVRWCQGSQRGFLHNSTEVTTRNKQKQRHLVQNSLWEWLQLLFDTGRIYHLD